MKENKKQLTKVLYFIKTPPPITGVTMTNKKITDSIELEKEFNNFFIEYSFTADINNFGRLNAGKIIIYFRNILRVLKCLFINKPDIFYFQITPTGTGFIRDSVIAILVKFFKIKIVYHLHGKGIKDSFSGLYKLLYRIVFNNTYVICLSEKLINDIKTNPRLKTKKIYTLNNGVSNTRDHLVSKELNTIPSILFLSNFMKSKGILTFLEVVRLLKSNISLFNAYIVGNDGDLTYSDIIKKCIEYEIDDKVNVVGPKYGNEKSQILEGANILIHPTENDAFPLVLLENLQYGNPIIATDVGGITDIIDDSSDGYVTSSSPEEICKKIEYLIENPKVYKMFSEHAISKYKSKFTLNIFEQNFIRILNDIAKG